MTAFDTTILTDPLINAGIVDTLLVVGGVLIGISVLVGLVMMVKNLVTRGGQGR